MSKKISAIVMASGKSRRMGKNKLLLKFGNMTFIENLMEKILKEEFYSICIVVSDENVKKLCEKIIEKNGRENIFVVENVNYEKGQSESIKLGITESEKCVGIDGFMFFSVDQPLLTNKTIQKIIENFEGNEIVVPKYNGKNGLPTIFSVDFKDELLKIEGDIGGKPVILNNIDKVKFVEIENEIEGIDIDTKEQYKKFREEHGQ